MPASVTGLKPAGWEAIQDMGPDDCNGPRVNREVMPERGGEAGSVAEAEELFFSRPPGSWLKERFVGAAWAADAADGSAV